MINKPKQPKHFIELKDTDSAAQEKKNIFISKKDAVKILSHYVLLCVLILSEFWLNHIFFKLQEFSSAVK